MSHIGFWIVQETGTWTLNFSSSICNGGRDVRMASSRSSSRSRKWRQGCSKFDFGRDQCDARIKPADNTGGGHIFYGMFVLLCSYGRRTSIWEFDISKRWTDNGQSI